MPSFSALSDLINMSSQMCFCGSVAGSILAREMYLCVCVCECALIVNLYYNTIL